MAGIGNYKKGAKFTLKSGNKTSFKRMGATEAIKQVDTSSTGYPSQDKSKMHTEREIYKAKLRGDYQDLTGDKLEKASYDDPTGTVVSKGFSIPDSPFKTAGHTAPDPNDGHQHLTNEQKLAAANRRKEEGISKRMSKYNIDKKKATEIWTKQNPPAPQPKSPVKTHKPGHTGPAPKTISRKEELLNQGFTQKDADLMIKSGAVTGVDPDAPGTPGKPGYEPPVKRSDLDKKGKETWDSHRKKKPAKATGKAAKPTNIKTIQNKKKKGGKLTKAEKRQLDEYRIHVTEQKSPAKRKITEKHKELASMVKDYHEQGAGFGAHGSEAKWETRQRARALAGKGWKNKRGIGDQDDAWAEVRMVMKHKKHTGNPI